MKRTIIRIVCLAIAASHWLSGCGGGGGGSSDAGATTTSAQALGPVESFVVERSRAFPIFAWTHDDGRAQLIFGRITDNKIAHKQYTISSGWSAADSAAVSDESSVVRSQLHSSFSRAGDAVATWAEQNVTGFLDIKARTYSANGGWGQAPRTLARVASGGAQPRAAMNADFSAVVVWLTPEGTDTSVDGSSYAPTSDSWSTASRISNGAGVASQLSVIAQRDGAALAVWFQQGLGICSVRSSRFVPGLGWAPPTEVQSLVCTVSGLALSANTNGDALLAWTEERSGSYSVWASSYTASRGWASPTTLADGASRRPGAIDATLSDSGIGWVAWAETSSTVIRARRLTPTSAWSAPIDLSTRGFVTRISLATDGVGNATVMFLQETRETEFGNLGLNLSRLGVNASLVPIASTNLLQSIASAPLAVSPNGSLLAAYSSDTSNPFLVGQSAPHLGATHLHVP